ncbi:MAG: TetR/AcrR family transcriptional regulator, partial [Candidatus Firestonebacteria bacterium]
MNIKERILINSRELFISSGFSSITMDDIAAELSMSKKTLYKYFPNKESLLKEAIMSQMSIMENRVKSVIQNKDLEIMEKFKRISEMVISYISKLSPAFFRDIKKTAPEIWNDINNERK